MTKSSLLFCLVPAFFLSLCHDFSQAADLQPFGMSAGDIQMVPRNDDFDEIPITRPIGLPFMNRRYDTLYVGTNGYISFGAGISGLVDNPLPAQGQTMLGAFWSDIDVQGCDDNKIYYRQDLNQSGNLLSEITSQIRKLFPQYRTYTAKWVFVVTFDRVKESGMPCTNPRNTFQMILTTDGKRTFAIFNYQQLGWIEHLGLHANAGFSIGDNIYYHEVPGARTADFGSVVHRSNVGVPGQWIFELGSQEVADLSCVQTNPKITFVWPRKGSIFGGTEVVIGGICQLKARDDKEQKDHPIVCKFGETEVFGERQQDSVVRCIAPPLAGEGKVALMVSVDGGSSFPYSSTYTYEPTIYNVNLIERDGWSKSPDARQIQLDWDPQAFDQTMGESRSRSNIDVDFFGWYLTNSDPINGINSIHIPLAQDVPNTGRLSILLSRIRFPRHLPGKGFQLSLNGVFRMVKSHDRNESFTLNGWTKHVPMIWSQLTDMDVFNTAFKSTDTDLKLSKNILEIDFSTKNTKKPLVKYRIPGIISPNFGQKAVQAMTLTKRVESVLKPGQWTTYFSTRLPRLHLATEIAKCSMGNALKTFCNCWAVKERNIIPYNIDDSTAFPPCPNTVDQAVLARGQFSPDSTLTTTATCNKDPITNKFWDTGKCEEHFGASLCVNSLSVNANEQKQQCCYGSDGNLLDALSSPGGGRVQFKAMRNKRDVSSIIEPGDLWLAQWLEEHLINRKPQEICCPRGGDWNSKDCITFRRLRRGGSARIYKPQTQPGTEVVFRPQTRPGGGSGDPHIWTLDGLRYIFNGLGEYVLLDIPEKLIIQGRTAKVAVTLGQQSRATVWSGLAFQTEKTTIQISLSLREGLNVFVDNVQLDLDEHSNDIFADDVSLHLNRDDSGVLRKISTQSSPGITIDVEEKKSVLQFQVLLPNELSRMRSQGLLGVWNGDPSDDMLPRFQNYSIDSKASAEDIFFQFGETWRVTQAESLFVYEDATKPYEVLNDVNFRPSFETPELPAAIREEAERICGGNAECLFDVAMTGDLAFGKNTADFARDVELSVNISLTNVVSCGFPNVKGFRVKLVRGSSYNANDTVEYDCVQQGNVSVAAKSGNHTLRCSPDGIWIGEPLNCAADCGLPKLTSSLVRITNGSSFEEDDFVEFSCVDNAVYESGDLTSWCTENGTWTGESVTCTEVKPSVETCLPQNHVQCPDYHVYAAKPPASQDIELTVNVNQPSCPNPLKITVPCDAITDFKIPCLDFTVTYNQNNRAATSKQFNCVSQQVLLTTSTGCAAGEIDWMPYCDEANFTPLNGIFQYDGQQRFQSVGFWLNTTAIPAFSSSVTSATLSLSCYVVDQANKYSNAVFTDITFLPQCLTK